MPTQFTVLASGSSGNASLLEAHGFGLLIDAGLGPRQLVGRLREAGSSIDRVHALVLTHTHSDHWRDGTLAMVRRRRLPVYLHAAHVRFLQSVGCAEIAMLHAARLLRVYEPGRWLSLTSGLRCLPVPVSHDGGPTFGFRFEGAADLFGNAWSAAYFADLGTWSDEIAQATVDVDLLALEFNHDVEMQRVSGRPWHLINRCLGDDGHLSNEQAANLLRESITRSQSGRLLHLVQLHLSRQCNEPTLALRAACEALRAVSVEAAIHTAWQDRPTATLAWGAVVATAAADRCA
ncbi:MAG TPA: MBL fold metallo-hydrolase [Pirellulales bacterium]|jgi:phosphoribosyl 1,2-cyclic phosphodiesterase|nr:MBL fold metallo-hydrolase [Pirellulales bacterium]